MPVRQASHTQDNRAARRAPVPQARRRPAGWGLIPPPISGAATAYAATGAIPARAPRKRANVFTSALPNRGNTNKTGPQRACSQPLFYVGKDDRKAPQNQATAGVRRACSHLFTSPRPPRLLSRVQAQAARYRGGRENRRSGGSREGRNPRRDSLRSPRGPQKIATDEDAPSTARVAAAKYLDGKNANRAPPRRPTTGSMQSRGGRWKKGDICNEPERTDSLLRNLSRHRHSRFPVAAPRSRRQGGDRRDPRTLRPESAARIRPRPEESPGSPPVRPRQDRVRPGSWPPSTARRGRPAP